MGKRVRVVLAAAALCAVATAAGGPAVAASEGDPPLAPVVPTPLTGGTASGGEVAAAQSGEALTGVFAVDAGSCEGSGPAEGSSFRMIQPGGNASAGPFLPNSDSPCDDQTYTPLSPGSDGGLSTAALQPNPAEPFDGRGNGTAAAIVEPQPFMGVAFAVSTNAKDPQSGEAVPKPAVQAAGGKLSGDLRAVSVAYNGQHFNQGSPKPDGSRPGLTSGPTGTYDAGSGAFTLDWTSTIVGGPFNGFTGKWHLEGTFRPADTGPAGPAAPAPAGDVAAPGPAVGETTAAAPTPGSAPASAAAPVTHPATGSSAPAALVAIMLACAGLGLRRLTSLATPIAGTGSAVPAALPVPARTGGSGPGSGGGGPAGGRARRP